MTDTPLQLVVIADQKNLRVRNAWGEFDLFLRSQSGVETVAVDEGDGVDLTPWTVDLVVVLGGDGAILRACRQMGPRQFPILGVNLGRLGFLADLSPQQFFEYFPQIRERAYHVVQHLMFACRLSRGDGTVESFLGLNEVVVSSGASLRMIDVRLAINGESVTTYSGDGVILSTPVGSTAHNLSAGGPILRQDLQAFVITPICPHTLTNRPLVDSADCVYSLTAPDAPEGTMLVIDGQIRLPLGPNDCIEVRKAPVSLQMAKVPCSSYYDTLHRKLGWGGQTQYRVT